MNLKELMVVAVVTAVVSSTTAWVVVKMTARGDHASVPAATRAEAPRPSHSPSVPAATDSTPAAKTSPVEALPFAPPDTPTRSVATEEIKKTLLKDTPECAEEYERLCARDPSYALSPLACFRMNPERVSPRCFQQVKDVREKFFQVCANDIKRFCPNEKHYAPCLSRNLARLTESCARNLDSTHN